MSFLSRRDFLRVTAISAAAAPLPACGGGDDTKSEPEKQYSTDPKDQRRAFPQGVASGDPKPTSVIIWTRVEPGKVQAPKVTVEVAKDAKFEQVVLNEETTADPGADHTIKLKVTDLDPGTKYYYRFTTTDVRSVTGETKTAPEAGKDTKVRFAFATCQDFVGRQYHAWRALLDETKDDPIDFVVYLGDYIYETDGNPSFQTPNQDRVITLPDGMSLGENSGNAAQTLEDYRALYKQYRSDEHLQEVHRKYPFVTIWDDHEFGDDCWGDHNTHFNELQGDEASPEQRKSADQAWFEYQPAEVEFHEDASFPDDIKIYRKLRFGKHLELFMTDERYFRDDHVIPEGPADLTVGKFAANSSIGSRIFVLKSEFDKREAEKKPTMLGAEQKDWLVSSIKGSDATWKIWGSEVQLAQMVTDLSSFDTIPIEALRDKFYLTCDQWDGYRTERAEILKELEGVDNLVTIVGDIHASYASHLYTDFDAPSATPAAVEYTIAGISSFAIAPAAEAVIGGNDTLKGIGLLELIPQWDELLKDASPHYQYANSETNGVALVNLSAEEMNVTFVHVADPREADYEIVERAKFRTKAGEKKIELL